MLHCTFVYIRRRKEKSEDHTDYNPEMQRRMFWLIAITLGLVADFVLPFWWGVAATIPIFMLSWWIAYRSDWF
jgi:uncharacterized membrane protein